MASRETILHENKFSAKENKDFRHTGFFTEEKQIEVLWIKYLKMPIMV